MSSAVTRLHCEKDDAWVDVPHECCSAFRKEEDVCMRWSHTDNDSINMHEASSSPQIFLRGSVLHVKETKMFVSASGLLAQLSTNLHERGKKDVPSPAVGDEVTLRIFGNRPPPPASRKQNQSRRASARVASSSTNK